MGRRVGIVVLVKMNTSVYLSSSKRWMPQATNLGTGISSGPSIFFELSLIVNRGQSSTFSVQCRPNFLGDKLRTSPHGSPFLICGFPSCGLNTQVSKIETFRLRFGTLCFANYKKDRITSANRFSHVAPGTEVKQSLMNSSSLPLNFWYLSGEPEKGSMLTEEVAVSCFPFGPVWHQVDAGLRRPQSLNKNDHSF